MAHPKKEKELKRSHQIMLRLTDTEYKVISSNAKKWIVNIFLDNFFKVVFSVLYRSLISEGRMYSVMIIPVHIIP